jgi:DNA-binding NarL/FixJ family response regulator
MRASRRRAHDVDAFASSLGPKNAMPIRILVIDDQKLVRAGFRMILAGRPGIDVVGEAHDGSSGIEVARRTNPDVILMDIRMPGVDGVEATRRLVRDGLVPTCRVIILTTFDEDDYVVEALRAGASGFLLKDVDPDDLVEAIRVVAAGDALLAPSVTRSLLDRFAERLPAPSQEASARVANLSTREVEILGLLARGLSNHELADRLVVTVPTVKSHVSHLLTKLDIRDRTQAVIIAYEAGVVRPQALDVA